MKIVVCVKQVPDTKGGVKFNPDGTLDRGAMLTIMNPDDKAGLEAALRIKWLPPHPQLHIFCHPQTLDHLQDV